MNLVKVISSEIDNVSQRVIKFFRYGNSDVQTSVEAMPYGVDSMPIKDMIAVYAQTGERGKTVIIGYLNKNQIAKIGEHRIFSTDENGALSTYVHLLNDGIMEVGGSDDNMVRYSELESAFNELKSDFNNHVANWNAFASVYVAGSPTVVGLPPTSSTSSQSSSDIRGAKIDEIKTIGN